MSRPGVLVIGDVFVDRTIDGTVTRISPEAPTPVVVQQKLTACGGGAANVAANLAAMGQQAWLLGVAAEDADARELHTWLVTHGVTVNFVAPLRAKTIVKTRITACGRQLLRVDDEQVPLADPASTVAAVGLAVSQLLETTTKIGLIVVADYGKGTIPEELARWLIADCQGRRGIPVFVDTKPDRFWLYDGAALLKPNMAEARRILDLDGAVHPALSSIARDEDSVAELAINHLGQKYHYQSVVVTRGERGATGWSRQLGGFYEPAVPRHMYDVTGAGDTFMAAMAASFLEGRPFQEGVKRANAAGSVAVGEPGTYVVTTDDVERALATGPAGKRMSLEGAVAWAVRRRNAGQQVVLANGCFDTLHHGHMSLLEYAKSHGDALIVAYNTDASVAALKGEGRPFIPERFRAELLSYLPYVDAVVAFDGDVEALVRQLQPHVMVKGAEYRERSLPGADYVASRGGRVEFAPMIHEIHTTQIVDRR